MSDTASPKITANLTFDAIVAFTRSYHQALESELDRLGRKRFPHHGERTAVVHISKARDGFVTLYLPRPPPDVRVQDGYFGRSEYSNEKILMFFSENDIEYIDVTLASDTSELADEFIIIGDGHPSQLAHKRRAESISAYLQ